MVNLKHKLTVDDLIVEYMIYKTNNEYEPSFTASEFMNFFKFFETKMEVYDVLYENEKLFNRFFERKNKNDWFNKPHMDMIEDSNSNDYIIQTNYKLSDYDKSIINTYFMDREIHDSKNSQVNKIRKIIKEYLKNTSKRAINENIILNQNDIIVGKSISSHIVQKIWDSYVDRLIKMNKWPKQCKDINKYLIDNDLSVSIDIKSIRDELIDLYDACSKTVAYMYHQDNKLKIASCSNSYLKTSNYKLLSQGYEKLFEIGNYYEPFNIDLSKLTFRDTKEIQGTDYDWYDNSEKLTLIENAKTRKLVKKLDEQKN